MSAEEIVISSDDVNVQIARDTITVTQIGIQGAQGPQGIQGPPGEPFGEWRGEWDSVTQYYAGDVVTNGNSCFIGQGNSIDVGVPPSNNADWLPLALGGTDIVLPSNMVFRGAWADPAPGGNDYDKDDAVEYDGSVYIALADNIPDGTEPPSDPSKWALLVSRGEAGRGFRFRGGWSGASVAYAIGDVVFFQGSAWIAIKKHTSDTNTDHNPYPDTPNNWALLAQKGDQGEPFGTWKGTYSSTTNYAVGDVVAYTSAGRLSAYYMKEDGPAGTAPTNANYWAVIARGGLDGEPGKNALTWWALHFPSVSGTRRMSVPLPCILRRDLQETYGTGTYTLHKNNVAVTDMQVPCAKGDRLAVIASGVSGDYTVSIPIFEV